MKKIFPAVFAIALIIFSSNVLATKTAKSVVNTVDTVYTEDKPNISVTPKHTEFSLKLKSNPTTGYSWYLREYDANLITPVKQNFVAPSTNLIGAPGYELWTFRVKPQAFSVPQQTTIHMVYARPWQGADNSSQIVFRVTTQAK